MSMHDEKPLVLTGSHDKTAKLVSYATAKVPVHALTAPDTFTCAYRLTVQHTNRRWPI
jgi:hypothetical protein